MSALVKELIRGGYLPNPDALTVSLKTLREIAQEAPDADGSVIKKVEDPYSKEGGIAILFGNLAPEGSVVKNCGR